MGVVSMANAGGFDREEMKMRRLSESRMMALTGLWSVVCLLALALALTIGLAWASQWIITHLLQQSIENVGLAVWMSGIG